MATMQPSNGSSTTDKTVNSIFPPMSQSNGNGIRPPSFPPNISMPPTRSSPQTGAPIFPPTMQSPTNIQNTKINPTSSVTSNHNTNGNSTPPPNILNTKTDLTQPSSSAVTVNQNSTLPPNILSAKSNLTQSLPSAFNPNLNSTASLTSFPNSNAAPIRQSSDVYNANMNPTPPPQQQNVSNSTAAPTPPLPNVYNTNINPTLTPNNFDAKVNRTQPLANSFNTNANPTPPPLSQNVSNFNAAPTPPLPNAFNTNIDPTSSSNIFNARGNLIQPQPQPSAFTAHTNATPPPLPQNALNSSATSTPPLPNVYNTHMSSIPPSNTFNTNANLTQPLSSMFTANANPTTSPNIPNTRPNLTQPLPGAFNANVNPTPPPPQYNSNSNPVPTLPQYGYNANTNAMPPLNFPQTTTSSAPLLQFPYSTNQNPTSTPPPPPPPVSSNIYNPVSNHQPMSSQPSVRPMYPSPATAYRPQVPQPPPQLISQTTTKNIPPPPPSTSALSSSYPHPQYNQNSNAVTSGHPGQTPFPPPAMPYTTGGNTTGATNQQTNGPSINNEMVDLLKEKSVVSPYAEEPPTSPILSEENQQMNCSPDVMRCSLNVIPQTKDLLNKSRLPFGILIHPFKDLESLSVIQGTKIVRCDSCKSYINPFIQFLDNTRWRCSICFRVNDLPQEFLFDPITKTYGDPSRRPEVRFGTVEYTATADYIARPPQPASYLYLLDVSHNAIQTGYLQSFCDILLESFNSIPGDARTQMGFLAYDSRIHFYDLSDRENGTFRVMISPDLDIKAEDFLPMPDGLMVTFTECRSTIETFLNELPKIYQDNDETDSALGTALQIAKKLLEQTGGRVTVVQTRIPNLNPGALNESVSSAGKELTVVAPTSDYYKKLSLDYSSVQIACDLFLLNSHHVDIATLACIAKYSGGEVKYYPGYHSVQKPHEVERFENDLRRYFQRKIGFEAVMRLRTSPALSIHSFHGSGFVRSVDLLVLPNINPDAAFGVQVSIDDNLTHYTTVTFQAALLYTSSKSERRIRVHTFSLPVSTNIHEVFISADQEAIVSLISKMATDRATTGSIQEARDAMCNVACDVLKACLTYNFSNRAFSLLVPYSLRLLPLYMLSMIKSTAFRAGGASKLDDRAYYLDLCKTLPIQYLMQIFYPDLYPIHTIEDKSQIVQDGEDELHIPQRFHLSFQHIDSHGAYILDTSEYIYIYVGKAISDHFVQNVFNVPTFSALPYDSYSLPELENPLSMKIHNFLSYLIQSRPHGVAMHIMREDSSNRHLFTRHLVDDRSESSMSYMEFLRYLREQIVK